MKKITLATVALFAAMTAPLSAWANQPGQVAPTFELPAASGNLKLADLKGKVVLVDFWASWCGPCKQSFPWMNEMQAKYGAQGFQIVAINVDKKREDADKFLAGNAAKFTVAYDANGVTPEKYAVKVMPTSFLIGTDGKIVHVHGGFTDESRAEREGHIKEAIAKK